MARQALHDILCGVLGGDFPEGEEPCYFEPPDAKEMKYPCIKYNRSNDRDAYADNIKYKRSKRYIVTVIDTDPDSKIAEEVSNLPYCSSERNYDVNGLRHFIYVLYYDGPRIKEELK